jgi:hypothetical protein
VGKYLSAFLFFLYISEVLVKGYKMVRVHKLHIVRRPCVAAALAEAQALVKAYRVT